MSENEIKDYEFVKQLESIIIPCMQTMLEKQIEHLNHLQESFEILKNKPMPVVVSDVTKMIEYSEKMIDHLGLRIVQYEQYCLENKKPVQNN